MSATAADGLYPCSQCGSARIQKPFRWSRQQPTTCCLVPSLSVNSTVKVRTLQTRVSCVAIVKLRLGASHRNSVPMLRPVFSGLQTGSCSFSPACRISLSILGRCYLVGYYLLRALPLSASPRTDTALGCSFFGWKENVFVDKSSFEPLLEDALFHWDVSAQPVMTDGVEAGFDVTL